MRDYLRLERQIEENPRYDKICGDLGEELMELEQKMRIQERVLKCVATGASWEILRKFAVMGGCEEEEWDETLGRQKLMEKNPEVEESESESDENMDNGDNKPQEGGAKARTQLKKWHVLIYHIYFLSIDYLTLICIRQQ